MLNLAHLIYYLKTKIYFISFSFQACFSQGLSFGTEDFNLAYLDPLNQK